MRKFLKALAYIIALPTIGFVIAVGHGVYELQEQQSLAEQHLEKFSVDFEDCGSEETRAEFEARIECQAVCDSWFQCRNDYMIMEDNVDNILSVLAEDVYTYEDYELYYGPVDVAETTAPPGTAPKPNLN